MEFTIGLVLIFLIFAIYIFKISYYYDYRYIGNVIRFIVFYYIICSIVNRILDFFFIDLEKYFEIIFFSIIFVICSITVLLFKKFLILKFGKEERFSKIDEIEEIGNLKD